MAYTEDFKRGLIVGNALAGLGNTIKEGEGQQKAGEINTDFWRYKTKRIDIKNMQAISLDGSNTDLDTWRAFVKGTTDLHIANDNADNFSFYAGFNSLLIYTIYATSIVFEYNSQNLGSIPLGTENKINGILFNSDNAYIDLEYNGSSKQFSADNTNMLNNIGVAVPLLECLRSYVNDTIIGYCVNTISKNTDTSIYESIQAYYYEGDTVIGIPSRLEGLKVIQTAKQSEYRYINPTYYSVVGGYYDKLYVPYSEDDRNLNFEDYILRPSESSIYIAI